ncbi:hypothetical protein [Frateuria sp. STR12]|uniref:hypothetical protein n=1 Tax=Frateuria hangzhouensis TaxID=2995589 RepID=UPI002260DBEC|nr:hypothetical protein [Frateuria sp. STR12]MCX7514141.1 hypothetical protein [Frateuria sp. STR12]
MGSIDDPRGRTNANLQDAIGKRAEQDQVQVEGETGEAIESAGGTGGDSGNGQMRPHHGFGDPQGRKAMGEPEDPDAIVPIQENGPTYQTGGVGQDRAQHIQERKQRESGVGSTKGHGVGGKDGGLDPPPGAPSRGGRG